MRTAEELCQCIEQEREDLDTALRVIRRFTGVEVHTVAEPLLITAPRKLLPKPKAEKVAKVMEEILNY